MAKTTKTTTATETPSVLRNAMLFSLTRRAWSNHYSSDATARASIASYINKGIIREIEGRVEVKDGHRRLLLFLKKEE
jgi:hypothetical protein